MRQTKLCIGLTLMGLLMLGGDAFSIPSELDKCEPHTYFFSDGSVCVQVTVQNTGPPSSSQNHSRLVAHETNNTTSTMEHTVTPPP